MSSSPATSATLPLDPPGSDGVIDISNIINNASRKPLWRENPRACLLDFATDPLDAVLLEHFRLFDSEANNGNQAAAHYEDLIVRASILEGVKVFFDQMIRIETHRSTYRNFGRQEILTTDKETTPVHPAAPDGQNNFPSKNDDWREEPHKALIAVARSASDVMLLEQVLVRDREMRRCFDKVASCFVPEQRSLFTNLALVYSNQILRVAETLRKAHTHGRQHIIIKRDVLVQPSRRPRRDTRRAPKRPATEQIEEKHVREV